MPRYVRSGRTSLCLHSPGAQENTFSSFPRSSTGANGCQVETLSDTYSNQAGFLLIRGSRQTHEGIQMTRGISIATLALLSAACGGASFDVLPTQGAPHLGASLIVHVGRKQPPRDAIEIGRVRLAERGYDSEKECEAHLGEQAKALGANYVRVIDSGRHFTVGSWSAPWCMGMAYKTSPPIVDDGF